MVEEELAKRNAGLVRCDKAGAKASKSVAIMATTAERNRAVLVRVMLLNGCRVERLL